MPLPKDIVMEGATEHSAVVQALIDDLIVIVHKARNITERLSPALHASWSTYTRKAVRTGRSHREREGKEKQRNLRLLQQSRYHRSTSRVIGAANALRGKATTSNGRRRLIAATDVWEIPL
jgi:hypothetical protein